MDTTDYGLGGADHSSIDTGVEHLGHDFGHLNHDLSSSYTHDVESISQGLEQHSQGFVHDLSSGMHLHNGFANDLNPSTILHSDCVAFAGNDLNGLSLEHLQGHSYVDAPSFEGHLSTSSFHPEAMPRSATPDYAEASRNEGWAKHYEDRAAGWASEGSLDMAASLQKEADYYHQKASENLNP